MEVYLYPNNKMCKPDNVEIIKISREIINNKKDVNLVELYDYLTSGYTILPSLFKNVRKKENFIKTKLIFLDFDNSNTTKEYISFQTMCENDFVKKNAIFGYETFSSTESLNKYRICFMLNSFIYSESQYSKILDYLFNKFPTADKNCKDVSRLYFGGTEGKIFSLNNRLAVESLAILGENSQKNSYTNLLNLYHRKEKRRIKYYYTKNKISNEVEFNNYEEAEGYIKSLDMYDLLGIENKKNPFNCIFNEDEKPSASIYAISKGNQKVYLYNNFAYPKYKNQNIIMLLKNILQYNKHDTILFLCDVLKIKVKYKKSSLEKVKKINDIIKHFNHRELKTKYPNTYKIINTRKNDMINILEIMKTSLHKIKGKECFDIYESLTRLSIKIYGKHTNLETARKRLEKVMNVMTYLGILNKKDLSYLEDDMRNQILNYQTSREYERHINVFELTDLTDWENEFEEKAKKINNGTFSYGRFSNEYLTYVCKEEQQEVFTQDESSDTKTVEFKEYLIELLIQKLDKKNKPYIYEQNIKNDLKLKYSKKSIEKFYKVVIKDVLEYLSLTRNKITNQNIREFGIENTKSRPNIIYFI